MVLPDHLYAKAPVIAVYALRRTLVLCIYIRLIINSLRTARTARHRSESYPPGPHASLPFLA
jgi:hypothetical protein